LLLVLIFLRVPIAVALAGCGLLGYAAIDGWSSALRMFGLVPYQLASAYSLSVIPLFILMGSVAARGNMATELFQACNAVFSGVRGALANATIGACALFGAICGSSIATAATFSRVAIPEMRRHGYDPAFAAGAVEALVELDAVADVDAGGGADATHQAGAQVAHQVAIKIAHHHHVELLRSGHHLHAAVVHDDFLDLQVRKILGHGAKRLQEQAVGQLEDVGLVDAGHLLAPGPAGPVEGEAEEAPAGDQHQRFLEELDRHTTQTRELEHEEEAFVRLSVQRERARIARDLHDVLGHTLSLITLKSELAGKLIDRDPRRAKEEIRAVEATARLALSAGSLR
jgi:signal transduction histidine kinase